MVTHMTISRGGLDLLPLLLGVGQVDVDHRDPHLGHVNPHQLCSTWNISIHYLTDFIIFGETIKVKYCKYQCFSHYIAVGNLEKNILSRTESTKSSQFGFSYIEFKGLVEDWLQSFPVNLRFEFLIFVWKKVDFNIWVGCPTEIHRGKILEILSLSQWRDRRRPTFDRVDLIMLILSSCVILWSCTVVQPSLR